MAQNTTTLKTGRYIAETVPAELAGLVGRRAEIIVAAGSKPAAAKAMGITLHRFNKEADWVPGVDERLADLGEGIAVWRSMDAAADDPWWYRNDEGIFVELSVDDDEDEPEEDEGYSLLMDTTAPEGPQVLIASRRVDLADEPVAERPPLVQYTEDGTRDFEDELDMGMDADDVAAVVEHLEEVREARDASPDVPGLDDDALPALSTDGVIRLSPEQTAELRRREKAAAELTAMDDRSLAVKLMAGLNRQDPDDARKVIDMGGVQSQMWMAAAAIAREHFNA